MAWVDPDFFFKEVPGPSGLTKLDLDLDRVDAFRRGPLPSVADLAGTRALTSIAVEELTRYGTGGGERLTDHEIELVLRSVKAGMRRQGVVVEIPFRDFTGFRSYWLNNGAYSNYQARRDIISQIFDGPVERLIALEDGGLTSARFAAPALEALDDPTVIREHLARLDSTVDADPRAAVSAAKDLVESTAKLVLRGRGVEYGKNDDLPALARQAQEALHLRANNVGGAGEEAVALKTILGSVSGLIQGIAELRNKVGTGHGRESVPEWVRPRHARLAAGAAVTWCHLMLETLADADAPWRASSK